MNGQRFLARQRRWLAALLALVLMLAITPTALATTILGEEDVTVAAGETVEGNVYAFGDTVTVDGTITGDLISAGSQITVGPEGRVGGDLMAAGGEVRVDGTVDGDVRAAGYVVHVGDAGAIGGEFIAAGFSVGAAAGSTVGGEMIGAGYQGLLDGTFESDVRFAGAAIEINGTVAGDARVDLGEGDEGAPPPMAFTFIPGQPQLPRTIAPGLRVAEDAQIGGNLTYETFDPGQIEVADESIRGEIEAIEAQLAEAEAEIERMRPPGPLWYAIQVFRRFMALALIGLLALWLVPQAMAAAGETLSTAAPASAGWGCLTLLLVPVALIALGVVSVMLLITLGAISLGTLVGPVLSVSFLVGAVLTFGVNLLLWVARVALAYWIGRQLLIAMAPAQAEGRVWPLLAGVLIYAVLAELPMVGGLLDLLGITLGLGALVILSRPHWPRSLTGAGTPPPAPEPAAG